MKRQPIFLITWLKILHDLTYKTSDVSYGVPVNLKKAVSIVAYIPNESEKKEYINANKELVALLYSHIQWAKRGPCLASR
jgi:hypothetical protein